MIASLILIYILIILLEVPSLIKKQMKRELCVFSLLFLVALYMGLAQFYGWPLPNPFAPWIKAISLTT